MTQTPEQIAASLTKENELLRRSLQPYAEKVAQSLTYAMRDAVLFHGKGYFHKATLRALYQRGVLHKGQLTGLGQQVRTILENRNDD